jgi:hypothetical protein
MRPLSLLLALLPLAGCIVYSDEPSAPPVNTAPWFDYADAGCFWDNGYQDFVWYFDVDANDDLGPGDVTAVWADVYDDGTGDIADSFDLSPEPGKSWYSAWIGSTTYLDPSYPAYSVVLSAQDQQGAIGTQTVLPVPCQ